MTTPRYTNKSSMKAILDDSANAARQQATIPSANPVQAPGGLTERCDPNFNASLDVQIGPNLR